MATSNNYQCIKKGYLHVIAVLFLSIVGVLFSPIEEVVANDKPVYSDGMYRYNISSESDNEVELIGVEATEEMEELSIPGTVSINDKDYSVASVDFYWDYYGNEAYTQFYKGVKKLQVAESFTGTLYNLNDAFPNLNCFEFYGKTVPKGLNISISNQSMKDILFIVPTGMEADYSKVIRMSINYYLVSDLYEDDIEITPTVVSKETKNIEYGCFTIDGLIYKVIDSAKDGVGKVQLVGLTHQLNNTYVELPERVIYNGFTYELISLGHFSLIGCGARVIVVPDSVTEMERSVFDHKVELLFLSKNCKVIPDLITSENRESNLRFVYVPEGVTTISDNAFGDIPENSASIILPSTIKKVGEEALYVFKNVTFLNKKPLDKVKSAIKKGTTVKVHSSVISAFKKALGNGVSVVAAKNIVKTKNLTVNMENIETSTIAAAQISATLTKGSNETVYWLSTDPQIIKVSSKGRVTPKRAGIAYVVAYTRTSGKYKVIKITVSETS